MTAEGDHITGQVGDKSRTVSIGKGNRQEETRASNATYFNLGHDLLRATFEEGLDEGMAELQRLVREFNSRIALLEYRLLQLEQSSMMRQRMIIFITLSVALIAILVILVLWKLYFGHMEVTL